MKHGGGNILVLYLFFVFPLSSTIFFFFFSLYYPFIHFSISSPPHNHPIISSLFLTFKHLLHLPFDSLHRFSRLLSSSLVSMTLSSPLYLCLTSFYLHGRILLSFILLSFVLLTILISSPLSYPPLLISFHHILFYLS